MQSLPTNLTNFYIDEFVVSASSKDGGNTAETEFFDGPAGFTGHVYLYVAELKFQELHQASVLAIASTLDGRINETIMVEVNGESTPRDVGFSRIVATDNMGEPKIVSEDGKWKIISLKGSVQTNLHIGLMGMVVAQPQTEEG